MESENRRWSCGTVTIHFHADIRPGYEKLAEVMNLVKPSKTGDSTLSPVVFLAAECLALFMILLLGRYREECLWT